MNTYSVFDLETDGLIEEATKIHCLVYATYDMNDNLIERRFTTNYNEMKVYFSEEKIFAGHNIIRFDKPIVKKILGIDINGQCWDTLGLSWYLYPNRLKHNLELWGKDLGIEKPMVENWKDDKSEVYIFRCQKDVEINVKLIHLQKDYLSILYPEGYNNIVGYLMFKLECAAEMEEVKWKLNIEKAKENLSILIIKRDEKFNELAEVMPPEIEYTIAQRPKVLYKKDGTISEHGKKWFQRLKDNNLPEYHIGSFKIEVGRQKGNPGSHQQLKAWLFSIGWEPLTFKYTREIPKDYTSPMRSVPQLTGDDGNICESISMLYEKEPNLKAIEGFFVIKHRISILEGFLEKVDQNGFLKSEINGFTNTLRFQHQKPIVNLPTIPKPYWEMIRECLIAPDENYVLCGSDMSGLEDSTKRHYMYYYDPDYVNEMMSEDFDPHLDIAVLSGLLTIEQANEHKLYDKTKGKEGKSHKAVRLKAKKTNFSAMYLAGPPKIALTANIPLSQAKLLHGTYWKRNWAIKKIAEHCVVKTLNGQMWLFNPVSGFWYSLRFDKDRFSTLNQGTGVYCFDTWVRRVRFKGIRLCCQYHDEIVFPVRKGCESLTSPLLKEAIQETNDILKLNVQLGISIDYGDSYKDIH